MATKNDALYEALYNAGPDPAKFLKALGPLLVAVFPAGSSATPEPKPSDLATMGIRPAGSNADQALVNARLGWSAQADRRLWKPEDMRGRVKLWEQAKPALLKAGVPEDSAEFAMLTGLYSEFNGIEVFNDPSDYIRNWIGLDLHTKLLAEITEAGKASGDKK